MSSIVETWASKVDLDRTFTSGDLEQDNLVPEKKTVSLAEKLKGNVAPVSIFQDRDKKKSIIYFVTLLSSGNKGDESKSIEIKQYDPLMNNVIVLLTIRMDKILAFSQLLDGRFVVITEEGEIILYQKNKTGNKFEKAGKFFVHDDDTKFITDSIDDFERIIFDHEFLVVKSKIIFMQPRPTDVIPGILKSQDLQAEIRSDYPNYLTKGPFLNKG